MTVDLSLFDNSNYDPGRSFLTRAIWFLAGLPLLRCPVLSSSTIRRKLLRLFGAEIGEGAVIKPGVRVKYPWKLKMGRHCWIGEDAWIDNLAPVILGDHVCISQSAYLCTGNHDWSEPSFDLLLGPIRVETGAWIGARASVGPGVSVGHCAVAALGSVVTGSIPAFEIHGGNPAKLVKRRKLGPQGEHSLNVSAPPGPLRLEVASGQDYRDFS